MDRPGLGPDVLVGVGLHEALQPAEHVGDTLPAEDVVGRATPARMLGMSAKSALDGISVCLCAMFSGVCAWATRNHFLVGRQVDEEPQRLHPYLLSTRLGHLQ